MVKSLKDRKVYVCACKEHIKKKGIKSQNDKGKSLGPGLMRAGVLNVRTAGSH